MRKFLAAIVPLALASLVGGYIVIGGNAEKVDLSKGAQRAYSLLSDKCARGNAAACDQMKIVEIALNLDFDGAIKMIKDRSEGDDFFAAECHQVAHIIGRIAYVELGIKPVVDTMPGICRAGIIHGAQEEWSDDKDLDVLVREARTLCASLEDIGGSALDTCTHGIGHSYEHELGDWVAAGKLCEETLEGWKGAACLSGAVMSYIDVETEAGRLADEGNLMNIYNKCDSFSPPGIIECSRSTGLAFMAGTGNNVSRSAEICKGGKSELVGDCMVGVGMQNGYVNAATPQGSVAACMTLPGSVQDPCLAGAALWIATNMMDVPASKQICATRPEGQGEFCKLIMSQVEAQSKSMELLENR
jgi:hypothetical protein